ncbi:hypothetical protein DFH08DRAFT_814916 [Mycena albidolilacea]|uniref:Uncharacterized protein n=1 Tax=Mycena albidolilacea TaxID=1033008 RepID=A0AAD7EJ90_9AGAR|nr:hypothetical protein DFH08DRAFT_814916 [Mycena albidolilacea]
MFGLGLALKPGLGLGLSGLWLEARKYPGIDSLHSINISASSGLSVQLKLNLELTHLGRDLAGKQSKTLMSLPVHETHLDIISSAPPTAVQSSEPPMAQFQPPHAIRLHIWFVKCHGFWLTHNFAGATNDTSHLARDPATAEFLAYDRAVDPNLFTEFNALVPLTAPPADPLQNFDIVTQQRLALWLQKRASSSRIPGMGCIYATPNLGPNSAGLSMGPPTLGILRTTRNVPSEYRAQVQLVGVGSSGPFQYIPCKLGESAREIHLTHAQVEIVEAGGAGKVGYVNQDTHYRGFALPRVVAKEAAISLSSHDRNSSIWDRFCTPPGRRLDTARGTLRSLTGDRASSAAKIPAAEEGQEDHHGGSDDSSGDRAGIANPSIHEVAVWNWGSGWDWVEPGIDDEGIDGGDDLVDDDGDDGLVGDAGGVDMGVLVLELTLEELGIDEDPSARISMLPSVKTWKPSVLENAIRWVLSRWPLALDQALYWNVEHYPTERAGRSNVAEPLAASRSFIIVYGSDCRSYRTKRGSRAEKEHRDSGALKCEVGARRREVVKAEMALRRSL